MEWISSKTKLPDNDRWILIWVECISKPDWTGFKLGSYQNEKFYLENGTQYGDLEFPYWAEIKPVDETCFKECVSCENEFDLNYMEQDNGENWFCQECYKQLAPVMAADYIEMLEKGEIEE